MKIKISHLRSLIREALTDDEAEKLVGKYLWPDKRNLNVNEPNTPYENELFKALEWSIVFNDAPLTSAQVTALFDLADTGKYSDILKLKTKGTVYRGINVSNKWLNTHFGIGLRDVASLPVEEGFLKDEGVPRTASYNVKARILPYSGGLIYGQPGQLSSWTTDVDASVQFAVGASSGSKFSAAVVLETDCTLGKFLDYKPFYKMNGRIKEKKRESEVVSFGPTRVKKAYILARPLWLEPEYIERGLAKDEKEEAASLANSKISPEMPGGKSSAMTRLGHPLQKEPTSSVASTPDRKISRR